VVFNTGPYTILPDNSILITANMQSETGFPSSHQLKSYVASKSRPKLAARVVLSADAGLLVLYLTVEALQGKRCQDSLLSGGGRSVRAKISGEVVVPGEYFLVCTKLDPFCYLQLTVQTAPCYVPSF